MRRLLNGNYKRISPEPWTFWVIHEFQLEKCKIHVDFEIKFQIKECLLILKWKTIKIPIIQIVKSSMGIIIICNWYL